MRRQEDRGTGGSRNEMAVLPPHTNVRATVSIAWSIELQEIPVLISRLEGF